MTRLTKEQQKRWAKENNCTTPKTTRRIEGKTRGKYIKVKKKDISNIPIRYISGSILSIR